MPKRFSASRLATWMRCPLAAKFKYVDSLPEQSNAAAVFGSVVHKALEEFNINGDAKEAEKLFLDYWHNPDKLNLTIDFWPYRTSFSSYRMRGVEMVKAYTEKRKWSSAQILGVEQPFLVNVGDYELTGYIDLLELDKNHAGKQVLKVIDLKTSGRIPTKINLAANIQFSVYMYAVQQKDFWLGTNETPAVDNGDYWWEMLKGVEIRGVWYHLNDTKEIDVGSRDEFDYMRMYRCCQMIDKAEEAGIFVPNISGDSCSICSFTKECGIKIDNPGESW